METGPSRELAGDTVVGVLGGTGPQGLGLARRLAASGTSVVIGSRDAGRAAEAAATVPGQVQGMDNAACAAACDVAIVAVPYDGHRDLLASLEEQLAGKVVIDCVNPLGFDGKGAFALQVPDGSACEEAQAVLPRSRVTGAFHHLSAVHLVDAERPALDCVVLVVGNDREATALPNQLAARFGGARGFYAGGLRNPHQVEAKPATLISVNRRYKAHAGLRVSDV